MEWTRQLSMVALVKPKKNESKDTLEEGGVIDREGFELDGKSKTKVTVLALGNLFSLSLNWNY